jgi:hypothetical protein
MLVALYDIWGFTALKIHIMVIWVMEPRSLVDGYHSFGGGGGILFLSSEWLMQYVPPKRY